MLSLGGDVEESMRLVVRGAKMTAASDARGGRRAVHRRQTVAGSKALARRRDPGGGRIA